MKFFIDTADVGETGGAQKMVFDGVYEPQPDRQDGAQFREVIAEICEIVDGPISAEVVRPISTAS